VTDDKQLGILFRHACVGKHATAAERVTALRASEIYLAPRTVADGIKSYENESDRPLYLKPFYQPNKILCAWIPNNDNLHAKVYSVAREIPKIQSLGSCLTYLSTHG